MASLLSTPSGSQASLQPRFDGEPGKFKPHLIQIQSEIVAISGPTPNKNGRSILEGFSIPDGVNPPHLVPLWTFLDWLSPEPVQGNNETNDKSKTKCDLWVHANKHVKEERQP